MPAVAKEMMLARAIGAYQAGESLQIAYYPDDEDPLVCGVGGFVPLRRIGG